LENEKICLENRKRVTTGSRLSVTAVFFVLLYLFFTAAANCKEINNVVKIEGKIVKIENAYLFFETEDKKLLRLRLAPEWFLKENNFTISLTDNIKIEFFEIEKENSIMQISKVEIKGKKYIFVDSNYNILWKRKGFFRKKPEMEEQEGEKESKGVQEDKAD